MKKIVVFGAGEFGSLIFNIVHFLNNFEIVAYGDDNIKHNKNIKNIPIFNRSDLLEFCKLNKINSAICAIGNNYARSNIYNFLIGEKFEIVSLVHPRSLIDTHVSFGKKNRK